MERTTTSRRSKPQVCEEIQVSTDGASGLKRARVAEKSPETVDKGAPSSKRRTVTEHKLENVEKHLPAILQGKKKIVVIVGAGISTSAGSKSLLVCSRFPDFLTNLQYLISDPRTAYLELSKRAAAVDIFSMLRYTMTHKRHENSMKWFERCHSW
jgi:hypothetical protein